MIERDEEIAQRQVRLRERAHQPLRQRDRPRRTARRDERADLGQRVLRAGIVPVRRPARPERVVVQLQALDADVAEHHRAEAAVADRQRLDPLRRGASVGQKERRSASARSGHSAGLGVPCGREAPRASASLARGRAAADARTLSRNVRRFMGHSRFSVVSPQSLQSGRGRHSVSPPGARCNPISATSGARAGLVDRDAHLIGLRLRQRRECACSRSSSRRRFASSPPAVIASTSNAPTRWPSAIGSCSTTRSNVDGRRQRERQARMRRAVGRRPERVGVAVERTRRLEPVA